MHLCCFTIPGNNEMHLTFCVLVTLDVWMTFFNILHAQDSTFSGKTISWDLPQCIEYAKNNNIQINTRGLTPLSSQQQYLLAKAARLPNLTGSASQNFQHYNSTASLVVD